MPTDLPAILAPVLAGEADLVMGSRARGAVERGALTPQQRWGNWLAARILRRYGLAITDLGPFRAIRADALAALEMQERTYGWSTEMLVKAARAGLRVQEVPVSYRKRARRYIQSRRHHARQHQGGCRHPRHRLPLRGVEP